MKYKVDKIDKVGIASEKEPGVLIQFFNVTVGIRNQEYLGFTSSFTDSVEYSEDGVGVKQVNILIQAKAEASASAKFPDNSNK